MEKLLEINELKSWYGLSQALFGVNLEINQGEVVALLGRNGMGKSTTIRSICGLISSYEGEIKFKNISIVNQPSYKIAQLGIGLVPEGRRAFTNLTVSENLTATAVEGEWTQEMVFHLFPKLAERKYQSASTLSGGEQQMLVIGRALMTNPDLLILDEATEGLSPNIRNEIWTIISQIKKKDVSIILVDKYLNKIKQFSDKLYILERGKNTWNGKPSLLTDQIIKKYLSV